MRVVRLPRGTLAAVVLLVGACGAGATNAPTGPLPSATVLGTSEPGVSATPRPGADLVVRATGSVAACRTFATLAGCAAYLEIQPVGKKGVTELAFPDDAASETTLLPGPDWPTTLAPGKYKITAHLDRVGNTAVLPPATPDHWVDRKCQNTVTIAQTTTTVTVTVQFDLDRACKVKVSVAPKPGPTAKPAKSVKPKKTPAPTN